MIHLPPWREWQYMGEEKRKRGGKRADSASEPNKDEAQDHWEEKNILGETKGKKASVATKKLTNTWISTSLCIESILLESNRIANQIENRIRVNRIESPIVSNREWCCESFKAANHEANHESKWWSLLLYRYKSLNHTFFNTIHQCESADPSEHYV